MFCVKCGSKIEDDVRFCPHCGQEVEPDPIRNLDPDIEMVWLVEDARGGDQEAVAELYQKTYSQVYYTVKSMIKDEDTVLDIIQDTYIKAFTHLNQFEGGEKFGAWVRQIGANTARDYIKKKKPVLFTELSSDREEDIPIEERFVDTNIASMPEEVMDQEETARLLREMLETLPEDQRAVIGMYYYQEMSVKEISQALDITDSAVKSRLLYGRKKIEKQVIALEKKGTKLYTVAPFVFFLWLFRSSKANAAAATANEVVLHAVQAAAGGSAATAGSVAGGAATMSSAAGGSAATGAAAGAGTAAATSAGVLLSVKVVAGVAAAAVLFGAGFFGYTKIQESRSEQPVIEASETVNQMSEAMVTAETAAETVKEIETEAETEVETEESESETETETEAVDYEKMAYETYEDIIQHAAEYPFGLSGEFYSGTYEYAIVQLQPGDDVPTLLLAEIEDYVMTRHIRMFKYNTKDGGVYQPADIIPERRIMVELIDDEIGGLSYGDMTGTGGLELQRWTLVDGRVQIDVAFSGQVGDQINLPRRSINWLSTSDLSGLY